MTVLLLALLALGFSQQGYFPRDLIQPEEYFSPSGEHKLYVNPSDRYGQGACQYQLVHRDQSLWSLSLPFTLVNLALTDDALAVGYGYAFDRISTGSLAIVVLAPNGTVIGRHDTPLAPDDKRHSQSVPRATGMFVLPQSDLFLVRIAGTSTLPEEQWQAYRMSTAEPLKESPQPSRLFGYGSVLRYSMVTSIPDTPLALCCWLDNSITPAMARFGIAKFDSLAAPCAIWRASFEIDSQTQMLIERGVPAMRVGPSAAFDLLCFWKDKAITFQCVEENSSWRVLETSSKDYKADTACHDLAGSLKPITLDPTEKIMLQELVAPAGVVIDNDNKIVIADGGSSSIRTYSSAGELLSNMPIERPDEVPISIVRWIRVANDRSFVVGIEDGYVITLSSDLGTIRMARFLSDYQASVPNTSEYWTALRGEIKLLNERGATLSVANRTIGGRWLESSGPLTASMSGGVAAIEMYVGDCVDHPSRALHFFDRNGRSNGILELPHALGQVRGIASSDAIICVLCSTSMVMANWAGKALGVYKPSIETNARMTHVVFSNQSNEVWVIVRDVSYYLLKLSFDDSLEKG